jgi:hypothetical protein
MFIHTGASLARSSVFRNVGEEPSQWKGGGRSDFRSKDFRVEESTIEGAREAYG